MSLQAPAEATTADVALHQQIFSSEDSNIWVECALGCSGASPQLTVAALLWPALLMPAQQASFFYGDATARLSSDASAATVASGDGTPAAAVQQHAAQHSATAAAAGTALRTANPAAAVDPDRPWLAMDAAARERWVVKRVDAVVGRLCGRPVGPEEPLMGVGLDSLTAVELRTELAGLSRLDLPPMLAFDYPTPAALASCILELMAPVAVAAQAADQAAAQAAVGAAAVLTAATAADHQQAATAQQMPTVQQHGGFADAAGPAWLHMHAPDRAALVGQQVGCQCRAMFSMWTHQEMCCGCNHRLMYPSVTAATVGLEMHNLTKASKWSLLVCRSTPLQSASSGPQSPVAHRSCRRVWTPWAQWTSGANWPPPCSWVSCLGCAVAWNRGYFLKPSLTCKDLREHHARSDPDCWKLIVGKCEIVSGKKMFGVWQSSLRHASTALALPAAGPDELPPTLVFDYPSADAIADFVLTLLPPAPTQQAPPPSEGVLTVHGGTSHATGGSSMFPRLRVKILRCVHHKLAWQQR